MKKTEEIKKILDRHRQLFYDDFKDECWFWTVLRDLDEVIEEVKSVCDKDEE